jgi:hypothetical protein
MARKVAQAFGYRDLHQALRTALDYVGAVRSALEAQEAGVKKTRMKEFVEDPFLFVRKACALGVRGPQIIRRACELPLEAPQARRRAARKTKAGV